jgi:hypothetical protein
LRILVIAIVLVGGLAHAAPPASLLNPKCAKAGTSELHAIWPIAGTKYFLVLVAFAGSTPEMGSTDVAVVQILVPGEELADTYNPAPSIVTAARAVLASCKAVKSDNTEDPTWTFTSTNGKQVELWKVATVHVARYMPGAAGKKCVAALAANRWCPDADGFWIGNGARLLRYALNDKGSDREVVDRKWVGRNGALFD